MVFPPPHLRRFRWQAGQGGRVGRSGFLLRGFHVENGTFWALYVCFGYRARSFCLFWIPSSAILCPGAPPRPGDPLEISGGSPGPLILRITILPSPIESVYEGRDAEQNASLPSPIIMAVARDAKHAKNPPRARPGHPGVRNASLPY